MENLNLEERNIIKDSNCIEYKSNGDGSKTLSVEEHVHKITPYLKDINNFKKFDTWEIELAIATNDDEERVIHPKRDNIEIMISDEADEVMK